MAHEVESMAYAGELPWHGLGQSISGGLTTDEVLVAAGLDWTVSKRPMFTPTNRDGPTDGDQVMVVEDYFALVRDSDNKVLGPAGKEYVPTQNKQVFEFFKTFTEAGSMTMETAGSLMGGRQTWCLARLNKSFELPGKDVVQGYLLLSSPHIWGKALNVKFTTIRVVCANTLAMAMSESKHGKGFRMPHVRAFDTEVVEEAKATIRVASLLLEDFEAVAKKLARTAVDVDTVVRYVADVYQPALIEETFGKNFYKMEERKQAVLLCSGQSPKVDASKFKLVSKDVLSAVNSQPGGDLDSARGTMWGAFCATTYYSDHVAGRSRDLALTSAWFGARAATKSQAFKRAVQISEVA